MRGFRFGIFSTFRDAAALDLFRSMYRACETGFIDGSISFAFCNREEGESAATDRFAEDVVQSGIPMARFSSKKFKPDERKEARSDAGLMRRWRIDYDRVGPESVLKEYRPDMVVLAGYMLILGDQICRNWKMVNLHPALPWGPKGAWEEVVWELMKTEADATGAMIHLVTKDLDRGPPISYYGISLEGLKPMWEDWRRRLRSEELEEIKKTEYRTNGLFRAIREKQLAGEVPLLLLTLKYISEGVIKIVEEGEEKFVYVNGSPCRNGMDLGGEVERMLSESSS
jgi:folate-dependent phosphoribosylglycinamide formyltransferase PurN